MPIYEYRCRACEAEFEQLVRSMDGDKGMTCPKCNSKQVERRLSVFAARDGGGQGAGSMPPMCGNCDQAGGSCPYQS